MKTAPTIVLSNDERKTLTAWSRGRSTPARLVLRAKIVLAAAEGKTNEIIAAECHTSKPTVGRWRSRFAALRIAGIEKDASRPGRTPAITAETVARILQKTTQEKPETATQWSTRSMAKAIGVGKDTVRRVWVAHGLKPHLTRTFKLSNDPRFVEKLTNGPIWFSTAAPQAASAFAIHLFAWFRLVPAFGSFKNVGDSDRSMSSENRSITPNTFDSEVPPLNTKLPANSDSNRMPKSQHTQKSFSMTTGDTLRRNAACSM